MTRRIFITLGSNIDPESNLPESVRRLAERLNVTAVSRVYRSRAVGPSGQPDTQQPDFLNAAVLVESDLPPYNLKFSALRGVEQSMGRVRSDDKFAPRVIDLDLALYGDLILDDLEGGLVLPDPDILTQAHVALPLADLDPEFTHPITGETLAQIANRLRAAPGIEVIDLHLRSEIE